MGGVKGALTKAIGMAKDQGIIKEVKKEAAKVLGLKESKKGRPKKNE